ncbi:MAG: hypothetical protein IJW37_07055 [Lachnospiraceae bacterium]|nr:hypothetical protein [Lachnospiraceae bacterium]
MQRLSAWFYLKNNKKRAAILILSFGLFFALLYGVQFFLYPSYYMDEMVMVRGAERMQTAYIAGLEEVNGKLSLGMNMSLWDEDSGATYEELIAEINRGTDLLAKRLVEEGTTEHAFVCNRYGFSIKSFAGESSYGAPMLTKEEFDILTDYLGVELTEGRMPEHPGEMVIDENMAKNTGFSVGDTLYDKNTTLVGLVKYETFFAAGIDWEDFTNADRYLFLLNDGTIPDLKAYFAKFGIEADTDWAAVEIQRDQANSIEKVQAFKDEIQMPLRVMTYSIAVVMGLTVFFVYRLHVQDRYSEWCLYRSLGYSEREVYGLAFREFGICMGFSVGLAAVIAVLLCTVGGMIMSSKGMFYKYLLPEVLLQILGIGTVLAGVLQIPVVVAMKKVKTIDALEEE